MVMMNVLRALADLGAYYAVAGMLASAAGGQLILELLLLQSASLALSFSLRQSRGARLAALLPALLPALLHPVLPIPLADVLLSLPPAAYLAYLAWTDGYRLSWERQMNLFKLFLRVFVPLACVAAVLKFRIVATAGLPAALLEALASVLLMRSLRHDEEVYLQPAYQLANAAGILFLIPAALVLGSEWGVQAGRYLLAAVYNGVIIPLVTGLGMVISVFFLWLPSLIRMIWTPRQEEEEIAEAVEEALNEERVKALAAGLPRLVVIAAAALVIVLVIRWAVRRWEDNDAPPVLLRRDLDGERAADETRSAPLMRTYAQRIRRQYRAFLLLCRRRGIALRPADTSTDIGERSLAKFPDEASLTAMRDLYQEARYRGRSSRESYQEFKRLLGSLKKLPDPNPAPRASFRRSR